MTDNIKPEHYRTGEIDLYEAWYRTYPFEQYRAIMQAIAERYMRRDKNNRVEDINKAIYTLERLKEKEIEHREKQDKENGGKTFEEAFTDMNEAFRNMDVRELLREQDNQERTFLLKNLMDRGFNYLGKDDDDKLWAYDVKPIKSDIQWYGDGGGDCYRILDGDNFPEVKWTDNEPTKISDLLATYENGGESGK